MKVVLSNFCLTIKDYFILQETDSRKNTDGRNKKYDGNAALILDSRDNKSNKNDSSLNTITTTRLNKLTTDTSGSRITPTLGSISNSAISSPLTLGGGSVVIQPRASTSLTVTYTDKRNPNPHLTPRIVYAGGSGSKVEGMRDHAPPSCGEGISASGEGRGMTTGKIAKVYFELSFVDCQKCKIIKLRNNRYLWFYTIVAFC